MSIHEHIIQAIQNYLDGDRPNCALMITGDWGAGKTYFWKNSIVPLLEQVSRHHIYVSLYGVASHSEIEQQISYAIFPFLDSKVFRLGRFIGEIKGVRVPPINYVPKLHRAVFCFDDLERAAIPVKDALGYINRFIEQHGSHVLILANELQIEDEKYKTVKEKVVGKTYVLKPDIDEALNSIWASLNKKKHTLLDAHRQVIQKAISSCEPINLRSAIQAVDNCNIILHRLEKLPALAHKAVSSVMLMSCAMTMEDKTNKELISHLKGLLADPTALMFAAFSKRDEDNENDMLDAMEKFAARYFDGNIDNIPSLRSILDFIETGWMDIDAVHAEAVALVQAETPEESDPKNVFLRNIWALTDQQIAEVAQTYLGEIDACSITRAEKLVRVFSTLIFIAKHQVIAQTPAEILSISQRAVECLAKEDRFVERDFEGWRNQPIPHGTADVEVKEFMAALNVANELFQKRQHQARLRSLFTELDTNYQLFLNRMLGNLEDDNFDYPHSPIFSQYDSKAVAEILAKKDAGEIQQFSQLLNQRYSRVANIADFLSDEYTVLTELAEHLNQQLLTAIAGMKRVAVGRVIEQLRNSSKRLHPPSEQSSKVDQPERLCGRSQI